jgi:molecular chaperone DnaK
MGTGKTQSMTITGGSALPKDDIDRMMREAEAHAEDDKARREEAEVRNQAEALVYQTEKFLKDNDEKLPEDPKERVKGCITKVNEALKGTDVAAIKSAVEELANESQQLGSALYAQTQADAASGSADPGAGSSSQPEEEIVDAEIVDEGDKK